jgi:hypothetical protein
MKRRVCDFAGNPDDREEDQFQQEQEAGSSGDFSREGGRLHDRCRAGIDVGAAANDQAQRPSIERGCFGVIRTACPPASQTASHVNSQAAAPP